MKNVGANSSTSTGITEVELTPDDSFLDLILFPNLLPELDWQTWAELEQAPEPR